MLEARQATKKTLIQSFKCQDGSYDNAVLLEFHDQRPKMCHANGLPIIIALNIVFECSLIGLETNK
jgi:hypothetical protein